MFNIPSYPDYPPAYPLTVFIATKNLQTTPSGWTAVAGVYQRTYASRNDHYSATYKVKEFCKIRLLFYDNII